MPRAARRAIKKICEFDKLIARSNGQNKALTRLRLARRMLSTFNPNGENDK